MTPKMWDVPTNRDRRPVAIYKKYSDLRPVDYCRPEDPYYISTHSRGHPRPGEQWFRRQPIGVNKLGSIMKNMASAAKLSSEKKLTNHSARKHLVQKLNNQNIPLTQITGHRNIQSVNSYSTLSENQQRHISGILNNPAINPSNSREMVPQPQSSMVTPAAHTHSISTSSRSRISQVSHADQSAPIFGGPISGGVFNVHVNYYNKSPKRRRVCVIDSDSDEN